MMKILFLDIDGVLNSGDNELALWALWKASDKAIKSKDRFGTLFDERCVRWIEYIVRMTQCHIVISSSWRKSGFESLRTMWTERNLPLQVIDITPWEEKDGIDLYANRGDQIQSWIDSNGPVKYCIVDDYNQMNPGQNFVQTDGKYGLTGEDADRIINILNS